MPKTSLFAVTALALALASSAWVPVARACKCMMPTPQAARDASTAVFEGRVTEVKLVAGEAEGMGRKQATLKIVRTWKGSKADETLVVETPESSAACGIDFEKDTSYFVYATKDEAGKLQAGSCGRTRAMSQASDDLAAFGAGVTPVKVEPKEPTPAPNKNVAPAPKSGGCGGSASASSTAHGSLLFFPALASVFAARRRRR
jgi:hypothetical protein